MYIEHCTMCMYGTLWFSPCNHCSTDWWLNAWIINILSLIAKFNLWIYQIGCNPLIRNCSCKIRFFALRSGTLVLLYAGQIYEFFSQNKSRFNLFFKRVSVANYRKSVHAVASFAIPWIIPFHTCTTQMLIDVNRLDCRIDLKLNAILSIVIKSWPIIIDWLRSLSLSVSISFRFISIRFKLVTAPNFLGAA